MNDITEFDSISFFRHLTESNRLAKEYGFRFEIVSGLDGFEDTLHSIADAIALVCVDDTSQGDIVTANTPHKKSFRTVFLYMRHAVDNWMENRQRCFNIMRELFRQFMTVLIRQRVRLRLENTIINPDVSFHEIDKYFFTGGACAWFQIEVDKFISLEYNHEEWLTDPLPPKVSKLDVNTPKPSTTQ